LIPSPDDDVVFKNGTGICIGVGPDHCTVLMPDGTSVKLKTSEVLAVVPFRSGNVGPIPLRPGPEPGTVQG
jgi:hypothetical protein